MKKPADPFKNQRAYIYGLCAYEMILYGQFVRATFHCRVLYESKVEVCRRLQYGTGGKQYHATPQPAEGKNLVKGTARIKLTC